MPLRLLRIKPPAQRSREHLPMASLASPPAALANPVAPRRWPWLLAPTLALLLLGAHFLRTDETLAVALCAGVLALLAVPQRWAVRVVQAALLLGTAEWLWTLLLLVQQRSALGRPWLRMALILGAVAALTAASAWAVQRARAAVRVDA